MLAIADAAVSMNFPYGQELVECWIIHGLSSKNGAKPLSSELRRPGLLYCMNVDNAVSVAIRPVL